MYEELVQLERVNEYHPDWYLWEQGKYPAVDWALLQWHSRVFSNKDHETLFMPCMASPFLFMNYFAPPRQVALAFDEFLNVTQAWWAESFGIGSAFLSYWCHEDLRRKRCNAFGYASAIETIFNMGLNSVIAFFKERATPKITQKYVNLHKNYGFDGPLKVTGSWVGEDGYIMTIDKEGYENGWKRRRRGRR
jgi:hypothetical protein